MNLRNVKNPKCGLYIAVVSTRGRRHLAMFTDIFYCYQWECVCVSVMFLEGRGLGCCWPACRAQDSPMKLLRNPAPSAASRCDRGAWRWEGVLPAPQHQLQNTLPSTSPQSHSELLPLPLFLAVILSFFFQIFVVVLQSLSHVRLFATPQTAARQASLSFTVSQSVLKLTSIESVMPCNHLILCHPLLLHQGLFQWVGYSHQVAKGLELQLQHQSFQWIFRIDFL